VGVSQVNTKKHNWCAFSDGCLFEAVVMPSKSLTKNVIQNLNFHHSILLVIEQGWITYLLSQAA